MLSLLLTERSKGLHYFLGPAPSLPGTDWLQNVETLKESLRLAGSGSIDLNSVDMAQFQGTSYSVYMTMHIHVIGWLATFTTGSDTDIWRIQGFLLCWFYISCMPNA